MGNFLIILGFLVICSAPLSVYASEFFGRISTMPAENTEPAVIKDTVPSSSAGMPGAGGGFISAASIPAAPVSPPSSEPAKLWFPEDKTEKILGQKIYPDGSLVSDETGRIFLLQGQAKKPIRNIPELGKYRGQPIYRTTEENLSRYKTREHLAGDLIREKKDVKIYELKKGPKHHILNLAELAKYYFGLPIYNLEPEEMKNYE